MCAYPAVRAENSENVLKLNICIYNYIDVAWQSSFNFLSISACFYPLRYLVAWSNKTEIERERAGATAVAESHEARVKGAQDKGIMTTWAMLVAVVSIQQIAASPPPTTTSCYADQLDKYFLFSTKTSGFEIAQRNTTPLFAPG